MLLYNFIYYVAPAQGSWKSQYDQEFRFAHRLKELLRAGKPRWTAHKTLELPT